jgi:alkylation response protein AidB-like acyl-CoA dehydrogenase
MEFELSKPQKLLQQSARDLFARECPPKRVRDLMATETALHPELWSAVADQGWLGIHLPEAVGGLGAGAVDLAVVAEEMGRACFPGPFLGTVWAATLIAAADPKSKLAAALAAGEVKGAVALVEPDTGWDPGGVQLEAKPEGKGFKLSGKKSFVLDAGVADTIVCVTRAGGSLALLAVPAKTAGLKVAPRQPLDPTRKLYDLEFGGVTVQPDDVIATGAEAERALAHSLRLATLVVAADALGGMQWILETAVEYAKTRQQFGKIIGSFQAVQHMCADMLLWTESSRSAIYFAAWVVDAEPADAERSVSIAKAYLSDAVREVSNRGVQVHGGIGFTWEHNLQLYYKRAKAAEVLFGDASFHRARLAGLVFDAAVK